MRSYTFEGIIIKRSNFGETDKILTFFTKKQGKLTVIAKGIRKPLSKRTGSLELFNHVRAAAVNGKAGLDVLTEVQIISSFSPWKNHLGRSMLAYQICETIDKLTPDRQPAPNIFDILLSSLNQLGSLGREWPEKLDQWLIEIVCDLGYWPSQKPFSGDIRAFIESLIQKKLYSPQLLIKLK